MIKKVAKSLTWVIIFFVITIMLLPKVSLWYALEQSLEKSHIILDKETIIDHGTHLSVDEGTLYFGNLELAKISHAALSIWLLRNTLTLSHLTIGKDFKMLEGLFVDELNVAWGIFSPLTIPINAQGNFGILKGSVDLAKRRIELQIMPSALLSAKPVIMRQLQKTKEGYRYVRNF